ncbi:hypothetical protein N658DRAFT_473327 [Parathielavia hyrcaniae]|uniref:Uncharacterized protein n=1 Tax=Parathielavia hyrcaniae TaxID=113614 RepID=A0AAN6PYQ1_9PEZI|nr:hypothetical protein N658DRAFT_473327 [Parathielavia hyrcaniae]
MISNSDPEPRTNNDNNKNNHRPENTETNEATTTITSQWQTFMDTGRIHTARRELERARHVFTAALHLCDRHPDVLTPRRYRYRVLGDLGWVERLGGRYEIALGVLREASQGRPNLFIAGEIGTVYRQLGRLGEAREAFAAQLGLATVLGLDGPLCRARCNLGIVEYQLARRRWNAAEAEVDCMVAVAMDHLEKGIQIAEKIQAEEAMRRGHGPTTREREARGWRALAYGQMTLCYCLWADVKTPDEEEMLEKAADAGRNAVASARAMLSSALPMARFCYGHVLLRQGHRELALHQFNDAAWPWPEWTVSPVMVMCKEPSDEHREYLAEMIEAGADVNGVDFDGYTALDHAVFSGDAECEAMVLGGLRKQLDLFDIDLAARRTEAHLRKGYREMLQEKLRPILYRRNEDPDCMKKLRRVYAETLAADPDKSRFFDRLRFIRYTDFKQFGRLPRSSDGLVRSYEDGDDLDVLVFFSYRWLNQDKSLNTPDDANHAQYRRMLNAAELYLQQNTPVDETKLCIWMDFACIDQDNPGTGVSALPIIITQCDAVISLVDDTYYNRAWCCVEAMMIAQLRRAVQSQSNLHAWYEHRAVATDSETNQSGKDDSEGWTLQEAPKWAKLSLDMKGKKLTYEHDRPKVMFLERQSRLLGPLGRLSWEDDTLKE